MKTMMDELNDGAHPLPQLPCDCIINNILTRIPCKSLAPFRCVCKQWCNLFNDTFFINLHRNQQDVGNLVWCKKHTDQNGTEDTYSLVCFFICKKEEWIIPFLPPQHLDSFILIESHGEFLLLLTKQNDAQQYTLYNPITKASIPLLVRFLAGSSICLAYDSTTSKYKPGIYAHNTDSAYCFVLEDDIIEWKHVYMPIRVAMIFVAQGCQYERTSYVFSNPAMHLMCWDRSKQGKIVSFDVRTEIFSTIKFPSEEIDLLDDHLLEMGGLVWFVHRLRRIECKWKLWYLKRNCGEWVEKGIIDLSGAERLLKGALYNEPFLILTDPAFKVFIKSVKWGHTKQYVCSYDMDLKQWEFVCENNGAFISYWNANRSVLEKNIY